MENDEVTRRRDLLIWSKRVRKIWRDLIPGSKKRPPSNAIGKPLEFLSISKTAHAPAPLPSYIQRSIRVSLRREEPDSPWLRDVSDASMRSARAVLSKWCQVHAVLRPPSAAPHVAQRPRLAVAGGGAASPFVAALGIDLPLLDFLGGADLARVESTCRAAWLPSSTKGWLSAPEAVAKRALDGVGNCKLEIKRTYDFARRKRAGVTAVESHCKLLHKFSINACFVLHLPTRSGIVFVDGPVTCGSLRAFKFRGNVMDEFNDTGPVIRYAPKNSVPAPVTIHDQWWTLMKVDGTRIISSSHLLEFLASKPDDHVVQARFNHKYDQRVVYHPLTCRSLDVYFGMARAIVPGWNYGGDLKLSLLPQERRKRKHYREANGPFHLRTLLSKPFLSGKKYRLVASEDSEDEDGWISSSDEDDDSSDEDEDDY